MAEINLLPEEERSQEQFETLKQRLIIVSIGLLIFTAISTLTTLGFFTALASKRSDLVNQIDSTSKQIDSLKSSEELIVVVKGKASTADKIISSRTNYSVFFTKLSALIPEGVYFTELRFSGGKISISGKAKTSSDVAGLVSSLLSTAGVGLVSGITVDSLTSGEGGIYTFALSAQVAGGQ